jgi:hypothetical protein
MIIPEDMKNEIIVKLNSLLKCYLVKTFEMNGYDSKQQATNISRSKRAKMILETIGRIHQDKEIDKEKLEKLFDMYKTYHIQNGGLWKT